MLKKNKDYVEFTLQYTSVDWARNKDHPEVCLNGYSDFDFPGVPIMDVVCKEFDHKVVMMSKRTFERLQARGEDYNLLLKKTGFDTVEELIFYLTNVVQCDTIQEAIASLQYKFQRVRDEWTDMKKKLEECEKDYISERDKAEATQTENEQLKQKLNEFVSIPEFKELSKKLYSKEDIEKMVWTSRHVFGCQPSNDGWMPIAMLWKKHYDDLFKLVGFSSLKEIHDYLTNGAEADTLHEAISKLKDQVKYTCDEWCSANSNNNSWKVAAECNSPKELIKKIEAFEKEIGTYSRALNEWKEGTGCPSPIAAKTLIESGMSYEHGYHEVQEENRKLTDEVKSWQNVTGHAIPEDYLHARINDTTPFDYTAAWQEATGCNTPEEAKSRIEGLENAVRLTDKTLLGELEKEIDTWQKATGQVNPEAAKQYIEDWKAATCCSDPIEARKLYESHTDEIVKWTIATNCKTPDQAKMKRERFADEIGEWQTATKCTTSMGAMAYIIRLNEENEKLKTRLNNIHRVVCRDINNETLEEKIRRLK